MPSLNLTSIDRNSGPDSVQPVENYRRQIDLPASDEMLDSLNIDEEIEVILRGTVTELRKVSENTDFGQNNFEIAVDKIDVYPVDDNEFTELAEDD